MAYTTDMSMFVESTPATKPKTKNVWAVSLALAGVLVIMAVAQLFKFETFPSVISAIGITFIPAMLYAALIVTLEVAALPFLLGMRLSPAMRVLSMVAGWIVVGAWTLTSLLLNIANRDISSGLLGDAVALPSGWWSVLFCLGLGVLAAWAAWGMWPKLSVFKKK